MTESGPRPDVTLPPPGFEAGWGPAAWSQNSTHHRGGHRGVRGTRVYHRGADVRHRGPRGGQRHVAPRFVNLAEKEKRKSWGEEWKPEKQEAGSRPGSSLSQDNSSRYCILIYRYICVSISALE